jgi:hypothetical protein
LQRCGIPARSGLGSLTLGAYHPLVRHGWIRFPADRIFKAVVGALVPGGMEILETNEGLAGDTAGEFRFDCQGVRDRLRGKIGFRVDEPERAGNPVALDLQLHFALWARFFEQTGGDTCSSFRLTLAQLADDLGYARQANGSHRPECKRRLRAALERLAGLRLDATYEAPDGRECRLHGPFWEIRFPEDPAAAITCRPGAWFSEPVWRAYNHNVGLVSPVLLLLRPDRDAWAIRVGSYLASLSRINAYRPVTLRVRTLAESTGLAAAEARNPARIREKLERALDRLQDVGAIGSWTWAGGTEKEPDMDSPADLCALATGDDWRNLRIEIEWPPELRRREHAIREAREQRRRSRRRAQASRS